MVLWKLIYRWCVLILRFQNIQKCQETLFLLGHWLKQNNLELQYLYRKQSSVTASNPKKSCWDLCLFCLDLKLFQNFACSAQGFQKWNSYWNLFISLIYSFSLSVLTLTCYCHIRIGVIHRWRLPYLMYAAGENIPVISCFWFLSWKEKWFI